MSRDNIAVFVRRWHEAAGADPALGAALLSSVRTKQDLGRLATNPLMCALICALHRERRGFLPRGRKALYDAALSMLLERRDRERDLSVELDEESQVELLQRLACWLIRNGRAEMDRADAVHQLERLLPSMPYVAAQGSAEEILRHLLVRSGLLREPATDTVDFVHRTFQDHLGGRAAVEERDFDVLVAHGHLDQWEDVIRMAVAHARADERGRLLTGLVERGDREPAHRGRLHLLAMACLEHAAKLDPGVRAEVERRAGELLPPRNQVEARELADLGPIVLELLPGPEDVHEEDAAAAVVQCACLIGGDAALPTLVRYRDHESRTVRNQLGFHWDRFDTETYADEIIRPLLETGRTHIIIRTPEELAALSRLGTYSDVTLSGDFSPAQIRTALDVKELRRLDLLHNSVAELGFLEPYRHLERLLLQDCPQLTTLSTLPAMPLKELILNDLPGLEDIGSLRAIAGTPLKCLYLPPNARDLSVLAEFPALDELRLMLKARIPSENWQLVTSLPRLVSLVPNPNELADLALNGIRLNKVKSVSLAIEEQSSADLRDAVTVFPEMTGLNVYFAEELDLAPLAAHGSLRRVNTFSARLLNTDKLPATMLLVTRR
ncbi:NACHT domain-containing protein [Streptomyces chartreusis]|uniref:NACHT domain-containing protein n=1 Tax=Streptomyces chartreusis TaxID=1969 RepID=UPI00362D4DAC